MAAPQEQEQGTRREFLNKLVAFGEESVTRLRENNLSQLVFGKKEMTHPVQLINKTHPVTTDAWAEIGDDRKETGTYSYAFTTSNNNTIIKGAEALFLQWTFTGLSASEVGLVKLLFHSDNKLAITAASLPFVQAAADTLAAQPGMEEVVNTLQQALTDASKHISDASSTVASLTRRDFLKILATFTGAGAIAALLDFKNIRRFLDGGGAQNVFNMLPDEVQETIYAAMKVEDAGGIGGGGPTETPEPTVIASPSGTPTATVTPYTIYLPYLQYGNNLNKSTPTATAMLIEPTTTSSVVPTTAVPPTAIPVTETPTPEHTLTITPSKRPEPTRTVEKPRFSRLRVEGAKFMEDGNEVILRGAVLPRLVYGEAVHFSQQALISCKEEIDILKKSGANFVAVEWNSGEEFKNSAYVRNLLTILDYAKARGMHVELRLHSRGIKKDSPWEENEQITHLNRQVNTDWQWLVGDPAVAKRLAQSVDIFGILAEARWYDEGGASVNNPVLIDTINLIRTSINNPSALCSVSPPEWGRDARELINTNPSEANNNNILIRVHPYEANIGNLGFFEWCNQLRDAGYLIYAGEFGMLDNFDYNKQMIDFLEANGISYTYFAIDEKGGTDRYFYNKNGYTDEGNYLKNIWLNKIAQAK